MNSLLLLSVIILSFCFGAAKIESISISEIKDTTLIVLEVDTSVHHSIQKISKTKIIFSIDAESNIKTIKPQGILNQVKIETKSSATSSEEKTKTNLEFGLNKPGDCRKEVNNAGIILKFYSPQGINPYMIKIIVLDPGHGGVDPGAVGRKGLQEKTVNLAIVKKLKKKLETFGLKVYLTRSDDRFVALAERTHFANDKKADLFISIHCNASARNRFACGFETYFLSEAKTDWERAVASSENQTLKIENADINPLISDDIGLILSDLAQNEYLKESYNLALNIQTAAVSILKDVDRGVRQAGFYVLRGCYMPAVLIECGFLSNRTEEKKLWSEKYRERIAETIFIGIKNFINAYEKQNQD